MERRYTVCRPVYQTSYVPRSYTVCRPVYQTQRMERRYTVMRPIYQTSYQERSLHGLAGPVVQTSMVEQPYNGLPPGDDDARGGRSSAGYLRDPHGPGPRPDRPADGRRLLRRGAPP